MADMRENTRINQINKLKKRNGELKQTFGHIEQERSNLSNKISQISKRIKLLNNENVEISKKIERGIYKVSNYKSKEKMLTRDLENLQRAHLTLNSHYRDKALEMVAIEKKLVILEEQKARVMRKNTQIASAQTALKSRKKKITKRVLELDRDLKEHSSKVQGEISKSMQIKRELHYHAGKSIKSAAILMTLIDSIINSMEENEFENMKYQYKVDSNSKKLGLRVRFRGVSSTHSDIKERIHPIMNTFKSFFVENGVQIKTMVARKSGDMIETLDIAIFMNKEVESQKNKNPKMSL